MLSSISPTYTHNLSYRAKSDKKTSGNSKEKPVNPISRSGEAVNLTKATFIGGLALGGRLLWEILVEGDFLFEDIARTAGKLVDKNKKNLSGNKKALCYLGAFVALLTAFVSAVALVKTAWDAPKIAYNSKVNAFKKTQEMDVYTKANEAEKNLYEKLDEKAKEGSKEDKEALKEQYLKLKNAKNQVPDFVKLK
ncbi:hypothetical protein IJD34_06495 [bacterium]|nr:hypothetical protein [bacterium]